MLASVEEFIVANEVDGSAADALRECSPNVQQAVLDRGGLSGARNPSSVLLARIRDASTPPAMDGDGDGSTSYVRLRGIPFSATKEDILGFFDGLGPLSEGVCMGTTREGRLSGEAFVQFPTVNMAREAIEKQNRAMMGDRYIELFPSTAGEAQRAAHGEPRFGSGGDSGRWGSSTDERSGYGSWGGSGGVGDRAATPEEVEQFVSANGIDNHAAGALMELNPVLQAAVIDRGGLGNARNPSSVLLSRIRDAQNGGGSSGGGGGVAPPPPPPGSGSRGWQSSGGTSDRVERFLDESAVDEQAAEALRKCHPDVQEQVMEKGVAGARNPSSALCARIREMEMAMTGRPSQAPMRGGGPPGYAEDGYGHQGGGSQRSYYDEPGYGGRGGGQRDGRPYGLADAVEDFIRVNHVDDRAADSLRACPPPLQEAILDRGDLQSARNPSSALVARMKELQNGGFGSMGRAPPPMQPTSPPCTLPGIMVDDMEYLLRIYAERDDRAADLLSRLRGIRYPPPGCCGGWWDAGPDPRYDPAAYGMRGDQGGRRSSRSYTPRRSSGRYNSRDRYEDAMEMVMDKGVSGARNPSSALLARLRDMEARGSGGGRDRGYDMPPANRRPSRMEDDVETFVRANGVDEMAADALRRCGPEVQEAVMEKGISGARNPSSALLARIRDAEMRVSGGDRRGYSVPPRRSGDRYAPY